MITVEQSEQLKAQYMENFAFNAMQGWASASGLCKDLQEILDRYFADPAMTREQLSKEVADACLGWGESWKKLDFEDKEG